VSSARSSLLTPEGVAEAAAFLAEKEIDAWLLFDFGDRNPLAHRLLGPGKTTRPAFAVVRAGATPVLLRHAIESSAWPDWPWPVREYSDWRQVPWLLATLLAGCRVVAMEVSEGGALPVTDRVPAGVIDLVRATGVRVRSSADLVTTFHSRWSWSQLERHRVAAELLRTTALGAFSRALEAARSSSLAEGEVADWIRATLRHAGITEQVDAIVAGGERSADPHYQPGGRGAPLEQDSVVLIDLWGSFPGGVPADQTWMGYLGASPPDSLSRAWDAVRAARDEALAFLDRRAKAGEVIHGYEVDVVARAALRSRGLDRHFVHRLGHSIDHDLHGSGPNLDDFETHDDRRLIPGIGFSVEPGVYLPGEFGVRSEVNVYLGAAGPEVTPAAIQTELLTASRG
jgi:Xaa-Pro aminopeptidase